MAMMSYALVDRWARMSMPVLLTGIMVASNNLPVLPVIGVPGAPNIALMAVFFWRMQDARTMPYGAVFTLGFLSDALSGAPLGLTALGLLAAAGLTALIHRPLSLIPTGFWYLGFLLALFVAEMSSWAAASLFYGQPVATDALVVRAAMSILLYLPLALIFAFLHGRVVLPEDERPRPGRRGPTKTYKPRTMEAGRARERRRDKA